MMHKATQVLLDGREIDVWRFKGTSSDKQMARWKQIVHQVEESGARLRELKEEFSKEAKESDRSKDLGAQIKTEEEKLKGLITQKLLLDRLTGAVEIKVKDMNFVNYKGNKGVDVLQHLISDRIMSKLIARFADEAKASERVYGYHDDRNVKIHPLTTCSG